MAGFQSQTLRGVNGPDIVVLKPPEGLLGVIRFPQRSKFHQEFLEVFLRFAETHLG
jgi:hypothetical protein